jgi:hypothetical protein
MLPLLFAAEPPPLVATGQTQGFTSADDQNAPHRVRSGVVLGLALGGGFGAGVGYPNDSNDIGKTHYTKSPWMPGYGATILFMGALADYLNVGFWYAHAVFAQNGRRAAQDGIGLRVEAFPLVSLFPALAGLGAFSEFGFGSAKLSTPGAPQAGGTQSMIGVGAVYEWSVGRVLGGHFGLGPSLEYDAVFTTPYDQNGVIASVRAVWYGGP